MSLMILPYKHKTYYGFDDGNSAAVFVSNDGQENGAATLTLGRRKSQPNWLRLGLFAAVALQRLRCGCEQLQWTGKRLCIVWMRASLRPCWQYRSWQTTAAAIRAIWDSNQKSGQFGGYGAAGRTP
jgi:hypothetical protein